MRAGPLLGCGERGMGRQRIFVGTSGWTYDDWSGPFYPDDVRGPERLAFYATRFSAVEVNATFYRLPTEAMIRAWNRRLPEDFHLVLKGSRLVTHRKKLADCDEALMAFFERAGQLKTLRVVLWQLPPSLHKDLGRLDGFLARLGKLAPAGLRHAVEFRHASWWDEEVCALIRQHAGCFVALSHPRLPEDILPTTDFLYLRFHGKGSQLYRYDYSEAELADWAERTRQHLPGRSVYAFFNNDYEAHAPRNAAAFARLLGAG